MSVRERTDTAAGLLKGECDDTGHGGKIIKLSNMSREYYKEYQ